MGQNFSSEPVAEKETERDHNDTFNVAVSSCQGWRMSQEDNHSLILDLSGDHKAAFFAVYDGHGSAKVSKHASESLWRHIVENEHYINGNFKDALESAFSTFDQEVNDSYNAQLAGTTAVCLLIVNNTIYCANIGDSRGVACINCECLPLSYDHKPENPIELERILSAGGYVLSNRVNGNLALSRAFGDFHYKGNERLPPEQQIVSSCPDIKSIELNDDVDFLVLACDGIWDVLSSKEVVDFVLDRLEQAMEPGLICEQLTTRCLATDYELVIGCDNMTVLLVCYTRGRSWLDYCTDIFNKNTKRLGVQRIRPNLEEASVQIASDENESKKKDAEDRQLFGNLKPRDQYLDLLREAASLADRESNQSTTSNAEDSTTTTTTSTDTVTTDSTETNREGFKEGRRGEAEIENTKVDEENAENLVLKEVDKEPELEQACTISELELSNKLEEKSQDDNNDDVNREEQEEGEKEEILDTEQEVQNSTEEAVNEEYRSD